MERRLALLVAFCWASAGRGLVAPPELAATAELLLVGKERSRYDELFELEMAVSAKARRVDELLYVGAFGDAQGALPHLSSCRLAVAPLAEAAVGEPAELVAAVRRLGLEAARPWTVEHVPLWRTLRSGARRHATWRFSGLSLALAQAIGGAAPALGGVGAPEPGGVRFAVLEGAESLRFGCVVHEDDEARDAAWNTRPFSFSGALDPEVARALVNVAADSAAGGAASFYDPCCGSGTLLYAAAHRGLEASGSDRNARAVEGARENLRAAAAAGRVFVRDASSDVLAHGAACCVVNPPWGEKVANYAGDNDHVLANLARGSAAGVSVACVDREARSPAAWSALGFDVLHACHILPGKASRGKASFDGGAAVTVLRVRES